MPTQTTDPEILLWPYLTRFYGLSPNQLLHMERQLVAIYLEAMSEIKAQEQLMALQVADFPHMDQSARTSLHRKISLMATVDDSPVDPRAASVARDLSALGIKVVVEGA